MEKPAAARGGISALTLSLLALVSVPASALAQVPSVNAGATDAGTAPATASGNETAGRDKECRRPPKNDWGSVAMSKDGSKIAAAANDGSLWLSNDFGKCWNSKRVGMPTMKSGSSDVPVMRTVVMSPDGVKLALTSWTDILISDDSGNTWKNRSPRGESKGTRWGGVYMSEDGSVLATYANDIWISRDRGKSWKNESETKIKVESLRGNERLISLAMSSTGKNLAAVTENGVWLSRNFGTTWTQRHTSKYPEKEGEESDACAAVTMSSTGEKLALAAKDDIWLSQDFGDSWSARKMSAGRSRLLWVSIASSEDGSHLAAIHEYTNEVFTTRGDIWTSDDSGATWVNRTGSMSSMHIYWKFVAISPDGKMLAALSDDPGRYRQGSIWTSSDFGATWVRRTGDPLASDFMQRSLVANASGIVRRKGLPGTHWEHIAVSADGGTIFVAPESGTFWISNDSGASWRGNENLGLNSPWGDSNKQEWSSVAVSEDGSRFAITSDHGIWVSDDNGEKWLQRRPSGADQDYPWTDIAITNQGAGLLVNSKGLWVSGDFGVSWKRRTAPQNLDWVRIASSASGEFIAATSENGIWISIDNGKTWAKRRSWAKTDLQKLARYQLRLSATGENLAVAAKDGVWLSRDSGKTWSLASGKGDRWFQECESISSSADGKRLVATCDVLEGSLVILTSQNSGKSWVNSTAKSPLRGKQWSGITLSADGTTILATTVDEEGSDHDPSAGKGSLWISQDFGLTWKLLTSDAR